MASALTEKEIRKIESCCMVTLKVGDPGSELMAQTFGVFDAESDEHLGDVSSDHGIYTYWELLAHVAKLRYWVEVTSTPLPNEVLREIAQRISVTLRHPTQEDIAAERRTGGLQGEEKGQMFLVIDGDGGHCGVICSRGKFFTADELRAEIDWVTFD